jgi:hypothetical protein
MNKILLLAAILTFFISITLHAQKVSERTFLAEGNAPLVKGNSNSAEKPDPVDIKSLCVPQYSIGCGDGDGFVSFAVEQIQNYNSGCANLNGSGWSQYLSMGPAILMPGNTYDFFMQTGYSDQYTTIWIDFDDDLILAQNEIILADFVMQQAGQLYTVAVTIPINATPGQHIMRARTRWSSTCDDPCASYQYGEAEDYYVMIGIPAYGTVSGIVTTVDGGVPVEDASIELSGMFNYSTLTSPNGSYLIDNVMIGDYTLVCNKQGYNLQSVSITIAEDSTIIKHFQLTQPEILVDPLSIYKVLSPGTNGTSTLTIWNNGNGPLDWSASVQITSKEEKDFMDLQFQYPVGVGGGEAGIETDGNFIYTSKWNGPEIYKYNLDGTYLESFTISGVSAIRDLAFDGTHFYGGAGTPQVFEMDFENQLLIGSFMAPTSCRAIAYNADLDVFYANNWSSDVVVFDKTGANLGSFAVGPAGGNYYGFAWDPATPGGPFLWGYAQTGNSQNNIFQIQLPSGTETGFSLDLATKLTGLFYNGAGGLFAYPHLITGKWTLGGLVQNQWIWGLELSDALTWISASPSTGTIQGGYQQDVIVSFNADDLEAGIYTAGIYLNTYPDVGTPIVDVILEVFSGAPTPPDNFSSTAVCDTMTLCWSVAYADSCSIYNFGTWVSNTYEFCYEFAGPGQYSITVTAWFGGIESEPSPVVNFEIFWPSDAEPVELMAELLNNTIALLSWSEPAGCANPDGYNIYRNGSKLNDSPVIEMFYTDTLEMSETYEYFVTAVYYFGESEPSNTVIVLVTSAETGNARFLNVFPNPAEDFLFVTSDENMEKLELISQAGLPVLNRTLNKTSVKIKIPSVPSGIYFLRITTNHKMVVRKVLIK